MDYTNKNKQMIVDVGSLKLYAYERNEFTDCQAITVDEINQSSDIKKLYFRNSDNLEFNEEKFKQKISQIQFSSVEELIITWEANIVDLTFLNHFKNVSSIKISSKSIVSLCGLEYLNKIK